MASSGQHRGAHDAANNSLLVYIHVYIHIVPRIGSRFTALCYHPSRCGGYGTHAACPQLQRAVRCDAPYSARSRRRRVLALAGPVHGEPRHSMDASGDTVPSAGVRTAGGYGQKATARGGRGQLCTAPAARRLCGRADAVCLRQWCIGRSLQRRPLSHNPASRPGARYVIS